MEGLRPTKLPSTPQVTYLQWSARGQLAGPSPLICIFISFRATSFPVSDVAGQFPHTHHLILFSMPFSMSGMLGKKCSSHKCLALSLSSPLPTPSLSSCVICLCLVWSCLSSFASARAEPKCVCVCKQLSFALYLAATFELEAVEDAQLCTCRKIAPWATSWQLRGTQERLTT